MIMLNYFILHDCIRVHTRSQEEIVMDKIFQSHFTTECSYPYKRYSTFYSIIEYKLSAL